MHVCPDMKVKSCLPVVRFARLQTCSPHFHLYLECYEPVTVGCTELLRVHGLASLPICVDFEEADTADRTEARLLELRNGTLHGFDMNLRC